MAKTLNSKLVPVTTPNTNEVHNDAEESDSDFKIFLASALLSSCPSPPLPPAAPSPVSSADSSGFGAA